MKSKTRSSFVKVKCAKCKNEQIIFYNATTCVNCLVCNEPLAKATGGKAKIIAKIVEVIE